MFSEGSRSRYAEADRPGGTGGLPDAKRPGGTGGLPDVIVVLARRVTRSRLAVAIGRQSITTKYQSRNMISTGTLETSQLTYSRGCSRHTHAGTGWYHGTSTAVRLPACFLLISIRVPVPGTAGARGSEPYRADS